MRKLLMLLATALSAVAFAGVSASAASAFEVWDTDNAISCDDMGQLTLTGATVSGGCLVEDFSGGFTLYSGSFYFGWFNATFDIRVSSDGQLYAVDQDMPPTGGWGRIPCRVNPSGEAIPWPGQLVRVDEDENGVGVYEIDLTVCITAPDLYNGWPQTITLDVATDLLDGTSLTQDGVSQNFTNAWWDSDERLWIEETESE